MGSYTVLDRQGRPWRLPGEYSAATARPPATVPGLYRRGIVRRTPVGRGAVDRENLGSSDIPSWPLSPPAVMAWRGPAEPLAVGPYVLADPLTYTSESVPDDDEASCIARSLPVAPPAAAGMAALVPRYSRLTPGQRGSYLAWMAQGRSTPVPDQRYALLFFYGLERRALVDQCDLPLIAAAVGRLLRTQPLNRVWQVRLCRFVAYVAAIADPGSFDDISLTSLLESLARFRSPDIETLLAGRLTGADMPLPPAQAVRLVAILRPAPSLLIEGLASELFAQRYQEAYGPGMRLPRLPFTASLAYDPTSWTVNKCLTTEQRRLAPAPEFSGLAIACNPLVALWQQCLTEAAIQAPQAPDVPPSVVVVPTSGNGYHHASNSNAPGQPTPRSIGPDVTRLDLQGKIAVPLTDGDGAPVARWVLFHGGERVATLSQPQTAETLQRLGYTPVDARHGSVVLAALSGLEDVLAAPGRREPSSKPAAVPAITTDTMPPSPAAPAQAAPDIDARALAARIVAEARRAVEA